MIKEMTRFQKVVYIILAFAIAFGVSSFIGSAQGLPIMGECTDTETLRSFTAINISGELIEVEVENIACPYGCMENASQYGADCRELINNSQYFNMGLWGIGALAALALWRIRYKFVSSLFVVLIGVGILFSTTNPIGLLPMAVGIVMMFETMLAQRR